MVSMMVLLEVVLETYFIGVRSSCAALVPHLLNCVKTYIKNNPNQKGNMLNELFHFLFPPLLESIRSNTEVEVQLVSLEALHEVCYQNACSDELLVFGRNGKWQSELG
jgi:hypothetical protein